MRFTNLYSKESISGWLLYKPAFVEIHHDYYGCGTGCCGSSLVLIDENNNELVTIRFEFCHYYENRIEEAEDLASQLSIKFRYSEENRLEINNCWEN